MDIENIAFELSRLSEMVGIGQFDSYIFVDENASINEA